MPEQIRSRSETDDPRPTVSFVDGPHRPFADVDGGAHIVRMPDAGRQVRMMFWNMYMFRDVYMFWGM